MKSLVFRQNASQQHYRVHEESKINEQIKKITPQQTYYIDNFYSATGTGVYYNLMQNFIAQLSQNMSNSCNLRQPLL